MDFKHTILAIFAGVALSLAPQGSRAGANSSGGGNIFVKQPGSSPVLLDLVVWQPDFVDDFTGSSGRSLRLVTFRSFENTEIARVRLTDQPAYWLLQEKLNLWKSASPIVISAIEDALSSMEFYALRSGLKHQRGFSVPPVLRERYPQGVLVTAAAYGTNINGAVISAPVWDSLGVFSQAGLIVHEALRDIQLGAVDEMPDEILQETAARIILDVPHRGETLDDPASFGGKLAVMMSSNDQRVRMALALVCADWQAFLKAKQLTAADGVVELWDACASIEHTRIASGAANAVSIASTRVMADVMLSTSSRSVISEAVMIRDRAMSIYLAALRADYYRTQARARSLEFSLSSWLPKL